MSDNQVQPPAIRRTAFGRLAFDIDVLRGTERFGYLARKEYVDGLISERAKLLRMSIIFLYSSIAAAIFLFAVSGGYRVSVNAFGIEISDLPVTADALGLLLAILYSFHFTFVTNFFATDVVVRRIHQIFGGQGKELFYLDRIGQNAIGLLLEPRFGGYGSTRGHMLVILLLCVLILAVYFVFLAIPFIALSAYALPLLTDNQWTFSDAVSAFSLGLSLLCLVSGALLLYPFKYVWTSPAAKSE